MNWSSANNWSTNALPTSADDVTIDVPGTISVTHASGNTTIRSLTSQENLTISGSNFTVTAGNSIVNGTLAITGSSLTVSGATATFAAAGATTLSNANLYASAGGQISLPGVTTYTTLAGVYEWRASGSSSRIDLPNLATIVDGAGGGGVEVQSLTSGVVRLSGLTTLPATDGIDRLDVRDSGVVELHPTWTALSDTHVFLNNSTGLPTGQFTSFAGVQLEVFAATTPFAALTSVSNSSLVAGAGGQVSFGALTSLSDSSLYAYAGGQISLPAATTYTTLSGIPEWRADGLGSRIDLPNLATIVDGAGNGGVQVQGWNLGVVRLGGLTTLPADDGIYRLDVRDSGVVELAPTLTALSNLYFYMNASTGLPTGQFTSFSGVQLEVHGLATTFGALSSLSNSNLYAVTGGQISLPAVTTYTTLAGGYEWRADGLGSRLELPSLTTIVDGAGGGNVQVQSWNSGVVRLGGLTTLPASDGIYRLDVRTSGAVELHPTLTALSNLYVYMSGSTGLPTGQFTSFSGVSLEVFGVATTFGLLTSLSNSNLYAYAGAQVSLPAVTTYTTLAGNYEWRADGLNSRLELPNLATIVDGAGGGGVNVQGFNSGVVRLDGLTTLPVSDGLNRLDVRNSGAVELHPALTALSNLYVYMSNSTGLPTDQFTSFSGVQLEVFGVATTFGLLTSLSNSNLYAFAGAQVSLPAVTTYTTLAGTYDWRADGLNSSLELPNLATLVDGAGGGGVNVQGFNSGVVRLGGLTTLPAAEGFSRLDVRNSGAVELHPALTVLSNLYVYMSNSTGLPTGQFTSFTGVHLEVFGVATTFGALASVSNSNLLVYSGAQVSLPALATYTTLAGSYEWRADGLDSRLDLPNLTTIIDGAGSGGILVRVFSGGVVSFSAATSIASESVNFEARNPNSRIRAESLASIGSGGTISAQSNGTVSLGTGLVAVSGMTVALASGGTITAGTMNLTGGSVLRGNGTLAANLTNDAFVRPGASPGAITIVGNYAQTAAGTLEVEINGATPGTAFDQLSVQGTVALDGTLTLSTAHPTNPPGVAEGAVLTLLANDLAEAITGRFAGLPEGSFWTLNNEPYRLSYGGDTGNDLVAIRANGVTDRHLFYNNSAFDGNNPAAAASDDNALATDKRALLPGQTATLANYSSYSKRINGLFVDVAQLAGAALTAADFSFKVGNNNAPASWPALAAAPSSITVRINAGVRNADRVTLIWPDGALPNSRWLQVTVLANANTGLPADDVFYFGNAVGESGNTTSDAVVNATDEIGARTHPVGPFPNAAVTNLYDFNRDRLVNATDQIIARTSGTNPLTALRLISVPAETGSGAAADLAFAGLGDGSATSDSSSRRRRWP